MTCCFAFSRAACTNRVLTAWQQPPNGTTMRRWTFQRWYSNSECWKMQSGAWQPLFKEDSAGSKQNWLYTTKKKFSFISISSLHYSGRVSSTTTSIAHLMTVCSPSSSSGFNLMQLSLTKSTWRDTQMCARPRSWSCSKCARESQARTGCRKRFLKLLTNSSKQSYRQVYSCRSLQTRSCRTQWDQCSAKRSHVCKRCQTS